MRADPAKANQNGAMPAAKQPAETAARTRWRDELGELVHDDRPTFSRHVIIAHPPGPLVGRRRMSGTGAGCRLRPGRRPAKLAAMTSGTDSNPEDEYADDEYADHDAEDRGQPSTPAAIPDEEPEEDVLEQRQEIPYREDDR